VSILVQGVQHVPSRLPVCSMCLVKGSLHSWLLCAPLTRFVDCIDNRRRSHGSLCGCVDNICVLTTCVYALSTCRTAADNGPGCLVSSQSVYWICIYSDANLVLFNRNAKAIW
jgi:hypothetical protein